MVGSRRPSLARRTDPGGTGASDSSTTSAGFTGTPLDIAFAALQIGHGHHPVVVRPRHLHPQPDSTRSSQGFQPREQETRTRAHVELTSRTIGNQFSSVSLVHRAKRRSTTFTCDQMRPGGRFLRPYCRSARLMEPVQHPAGSIMPGYPGITAMASTRPRSPASGGHAWHLVRRAFHSVPACGWFGAGRGRSRGCPPVGVADRRACLWS